MIPLGILASAGGAASFELISTTTLGASQATLTFTLSSAQQANYKHLQLRISGRTDRANSYDGAKIRFNGGTSTDYAFHVISGGGSGAANAYSDAGSTYWYLGIGSFESTNSPAGAYGLAICDILDAFSTSKTKTMRSFSGSISVPNNLSQSALWNNTSAITSIAIQPDVGTNWLSGSRFSLYGVKG